ncbi:hypothetical protein PsorP6_000408 [Peronosclerospora sorghi]|uniref:Uncharacterized protein n=1 Tax=Peronosclerospora sorghi TaxID=230839 RepID=A0ACC0WV95_9STRA|nr:hypothetical protein PsorP6_000408 [Peronosclerospora sorghi]
MYCIRIRSYLFGHMESEVQLLLGATALGYGILFVICAWLVIYMYHHRSGALRGDTRAARKVLLPAFQPLLWLLTIVSLLYSITFTLLVFGRPHVTKLHRVETEIFYCGRLFVFALPILYLKQRAVTTRALIRAALYSLLLAIYNVPIVWIMDVKARTHAAHYATMLTEILPLVVFGWVCLRPLERASETTLREYVVFVTIYYVFRLTYKQLQYLQIDRKKAPLLIGLTCVFWGSLVPVVIWRVLKADTAHWRGLGRRAAHLQTLFRQRYHHLHERVSSRGLHVLIEMHRKQIIDFAYLELQSKIGAGTNAVVFRGTLYSKFPVAIKVYTPRVLNEDVVAEFSHEAALCGVLQHPNVVRFYGMCVCPPTVCLVSELCQGSLEDVTRASARMQLLNHRRRQTVYEKDDALEEQHRRQQLLIDLNYMIDATRAVVYMHSFTPAFLHRDLKPSNFLVDDYGTCKLTDFGESRSFPAKQKADGLNRMTKDISTMATTAASAMPSTLLLGETYMEVQTRSTVSQTEPPTTSLRPSLRDRGRSAMTVRTKRRRATDFPKTTRCSLPYVEKKRSSTTACHRTTLEMPACACRKLGRDFGDLECRQKRRFRRNKKWFSATEEKISTGKLHALGVESQPFLAGTDEYGITCNFHSWDYSVEETCLGANDDKDMDYDTEDVNSPGNVNLGSSRSSVVII